MRPSMDLRHSPSRLPLRAASTKISARAHSGPHINSDEAEEQLRREVAFDPDLWIVEVEDGVDGAWLDLEP